MAERVAILGAGNGGCAAAADLGRRGFGIALYSRSDATLARFRDQGGIPYTGVIGDGFTEVDIFTTDIAEAVDGADHVMVVTPATAHAALADALAECLPRDASVLLNPGSTGGALHVAARLRKKGRTDVAVAETATLTYACRMKEGPTSWIKNEVTELPFAAFPAKRTNELLERFRRLYPNLKPAPNVLATSLANLNAVEHPPGMVMNAGWIEDTQGNFKFYFEGVTPGVARVLESVDRERLATAHAIEALSGVRVDAQSCIDFFYEASYTTREAWETGSMYEALQASIPNRPTQAPPSLDNRYLQEDVPFGLVPLVHLAEWADTEAPLMRALVTTASALTGKDFLADGLSLTDMGLDAVELGLLANYLYEGSSSS